MSTEIEEAPEGWWSPCWGSEAIIVYLGIVKPIKLFKTYCFVFVITGLFFACNNKTIKTGTSQNKPPNFIVFIADDISWDDLGCYGNGQVHTPNIDILSQGSIVFDNAYLTTSSCSPSRNSIITGRYPHNTGAAELHTAPPIDMISLPEILKSHGYFTAQAGKFHMGEYAIRGFDQVHDKKNINGPGGENYWEQLVGNVPEDQPFFLWLASYDAHRDWGANDFTGTHSPSTIEVPEYLVDGPETRQDLAHYYDEITRFDHHLGRVINKLKVNDRFENTLVIVMADNGRPFPHSKTRVNNQGVKTPFIIHYSPLNIAMNTRSQSLISAVDIAPTLIDLAGIDTVPNFQGVSFKRVLKNPSMKFRNHVFAEHNWHDYEAHERMVRGERYMYIYNSRPQYAQRGPLDAVNSPTYKALKQAHTRALISEIQADIFKAPRPQEEFYDLQEDPYQFNNLIGRENLSDKYTELKSILQNWMETTGDNRPTELTRDWYFREPVYLNENDPSPKRKNNKTPNHGIRGEMPGSANAAIQNNNKGPF